MIKKKTRTQKQNHKPKQNKNHLTHKGGKQSFLSAIGHSLVHVKKNDYKIHVPGSGLFTVLNPKKLSSFGKLDKPKPLSIIFNYKTPNSIDLADISDNTELSSNAIIREPYVFIDSLGKYIIAMYRIIYKNNKTKILLHWLVGFNNRDQKKIFSYIAPNVKLGSIHRFMLIIYKYPNTYNSNDPNFVNINNIDNKAKAYEEFRNYIYMSKIVPIKTIIFRVKGDIQGIDIFNMLNKTSSSKLKQTEPQAYWKYSKA